MPSPKPHLFHVIPSFAHGGVPIRISYLVNHFGTAARHTLLSMNGDYSCRSRLTDHVDIKFLEDVRISGSLWQRVTSALALIRDVSPDVLLTYQWGSVEVALANRFFPLARHIHLESGFGPEEAVKQIPRRVWMRRLALGNVEQLVVPSQSLVSIARDIWKIPNEKINYLPNGVDCEKYAVSPVPGIMPNFEKQAGEITLGTMTPLRAEKNLPRMIRSFAACAEACPNYKLRLVIMGEGQERAALERQIAALGLQDRVLLAGHIDQPAQALGWLDIYLISSDTEQMPNSVNQAMAAGLPVVGLAVGDVRHIVSAVNKPFIVPAGDEEAFTQKTIMMVRDKLKREEIGAENQAHVKATYDQAFMYEGYAKVWGLSGV
ncbi:MAG: glycosyl transferase family 1 [Kordiimonas sp.]|nr:glycosyl transferase family 1 [Kordiimonas sp.]